MYSQLPSNVVVVSSEQQRDSAVHTHVSILLKTSPPSRLPHNTEPSSRLYNRSLLVIHFKYSSVFMSIPNSLSFPRHPSPSNHKLILQVCESLCFVSSFVSFLFGFHIKGMSSSIFPYLSDLVHAVWHSLVQLCCCKWHYFILFNGRVILYCVYVPHLLYPFLCWTFRLLPCLGYCKQCCNEHWSVCILSDHIFLWIYAQE